MSEFKLRCRNDINVQKWATTASCSHCGAVIEDIPPEFFEPVKKDEGRYDDAARDSQGPYRKDEGKPAGDEEAGAGEGRPGFGTTGREAASPSAPPPFPSSYPPHQSHVNPYKRLNVIEGISLSLRMLTSHFGTYMGYWIVPVIVLLVLALTQSYVTEEVFDLEIDEESFEDSDDEKGGDEGEKKDEKDEDMAELARFCSVFCGLILLSVFLNGFVTVFFFTGVAAITAEIERKGTSSPATGFQTIRGHARDILVIACVFGLMLAGGLLLVLVGAFIVCYWYIFAAVIFAVEGKRRVQNVLASSKNFAQQSGAFLYLLLLLVLYILAIVIVDQIVNSFLPSSVGTSIAVAVISSLLVLIVLIAITIFYLHERRRLGRIWALQEQYPYGQSPYSQSPYQYPPKYPPQGPGGPGYPPR